MDWAGALPFFVEALVRRQPPDSERTVAELVLDHPSAARALEALGIDTCCDAGWPLEEACRQAGTTPRHALEAVARAESVVREHADESLLAQVEALVSAQRDVRAAMERVEALAEIVARSHSGTRPELGGVVRDLLECRERIEAHAIAEEAALFARVVGAPPRTELHDEQDRVQELRRDLRAIADDYAATPHACLTARALLAEVRALEAALGAHVERQRAFEALLTSRAP